MAVPVVALSATLGEAGLKLIVAEEPCRKKFADAIDHHPQSRRMAAKIARANIMGT
jgi:hypothetical protein